MGKIYWPERREFARGTRKRFMPPKLGPKVQELIELVCCKVYSALKYPLKRLNEGLFKRGAKP